MTNAEAAVSAAMRALNRRLDPDEARLIALTMTILGVDPDGQWTRPATRED